MVDFELVNDILLFECPFDAKGDDEDGKDVKDIVLPDRLGDGDLKVRSVIEPLLLAL